MSAPNPHHHTLCDVNLGPDFEVEAGVVRITMFVCMGECWPDNVAAEGGAVTLPDVVQRPDGLWEGA